MGVMLLESKRDKNGDLDKKIPKEIRFFVISFVIKNRQPSLIFTACLTLVV